MKGREIFSKYSSLIKVFSKIVSLIPKPIFEGLYNLSSNSESKLSLFIRYLFIKKYSKESGVNIYIGKNVIIKNVNNLKLGSNVSIHAFNYLDAAGGIDIGNNVSIANMTSIISFDHMWDNKTIPIKYNNIIKKAIKINDDVWIGSNVKILQGVVIHRRAIVAAGAVVNKNVDSNTVVAGIPAKVIKKID